jgi:hypothetical protein
MICAENGHVELLQWMRAQRPPFPCDFEACLELAEDEAVRAYFRTGLDPLAMCNIDTDDDDAVTLVVADAVAHIGQKVDVNATDSDG